MNFLNVPEVTLYKTVNSILNFLRSDLDSNVSTPEKSFLYKLCGDETMSNGRYQYFEQAKKVFTSKIDDPRFIDVHMMYNLQSAKPVSIVISHSAESTGSGNGLGLDEAFHTQVVNDNETFNNSLTRRYNATYQLIIVTDNTNESVLVYQILKSMLLSFTNHLNFLGIANLKIGGQEMRLQSDHIPKHLNTKALTLNFEYDCHTLDLQEYPEMTSIIYNGIIKNK